MSRNQRRNRRTKPSGSQNARTGRDGTEDRSVEAVRLRASTETKSSLKTTELIAYAGTVLAVIMTALALDADGEGGGDPFGAESAIRYITYLTVGYLIARGLAKSGSHENRVEHDTDSDDAAPRTVMVDDEEGRDDVAGEPDGAVEASEPAVVPSDEDSAAPRTVDARS